MKLVEVKITISRNCLVICEGLKLHILYFYVNFVEKIDVLERRIGRNKFLQGWLVAALFQKKRKKKRRKKWEDEHRKLYVAADVHASWKKLKCMCLYSTDTAFAQHLLSHMRVIVTKAL